MQNQNFQGVLLRELGDGLILRRSSPADAEALADFCARIHSDDGPDQPDLHIGAWTRDLLTKPHPTFHPEDFTIVVEAASGRIVSTMNLIPQTWTYEGIPFDVGRPELVGTLPEYRNRGLIRLQFEEIHRWSAGRGQMVQVITGIPFYYRLFGYEMALDLGGWRAGFEGTLPPLKAGGEEPYRIRPARRGDLPFAAELYAQAQKRYMIACERGLDIYEYEQTVEDPRSEKHFPLKMIEDRNGQVLGYLQHHNHLSGKTLMAFDFELKPGLSWLEASPCIARYLWTQGQQYAREEGGACLSIGFMLGQQHPAYEALGPALPTYHEPYAFFMRVPDLPGFIRHIIPALEKRLAASIAVGYSGEITLNFYREGLKIVFEAGRIKTVEEWQPPTSDDGSAAFPGLTFLQLVFGYRSFSELKQAFADCSSNDRTADALLNILFPKRLSAVFPVA